VAGNYPGQPQINTSTSLCHASRPRLGLLRSANDCLPLARPTLHLGAHLFEQFGATSPSSPSSSIKPACQGPLQVQLGAALGSHQRRAAGRLAGNPIEIIRCWRRPATSLRERAYHSAPARHRRPHLGAGWPRLPSGWTEDTLRPLCTALSTLRIGLTPAGRAQTNRPDACGPANEACT